MNDLLQRSIERTYPLLLDLQLADVRFRLHMNKPELRDDLSDYFKIFVKQNIEPDIEIHAWEGDAPEPDCPFTVKQPDPGKTKIKEEYCDQGSVRWVRKRLTGMVFGFDENRHLAAGPCVKNSNQVINFVNNRLIQRKLETGSLLFHAAGVCRGGRGIALCGFSGMGKSTLALHIMSRGLDFVSNDRLMVQEDEGKVIMTGVAKYPRINPGTILNNEDLERVMPDDEREEFVDLPPDRLWNIEKKYDVMIEDVYGPGRFHLDAEMDGLVILNWQRDSPDPLDIHTVDIASRPDLLPAFMKSPGLFYTPREKGLEFGVERYLELLRDCRVYEVLGGVDFEGAAEYFARLLRDE